MARAWADIDLDALRHNVDVLCAAAAGAELCAVVKADAYGHGMERIAAAALDAGASRLAVAQVAEGERLRLAGIDAEIWVMSEPRPDEMATAAWSRLQPTVYSSAGIAAAAAGGVRTVHLKIDTGMHRVGARPDDAVSLGRAATGAGLHLGSVWTHLATADDLTTADADAQLDRYDETIDTLTAAGIEVGLRHAANSAGTLFRPRAHHDVVRPGIALYGIAPDVAVLGHPAVAPLRPVMQLSTRVGFVKRLEPGDRVSYGLRGGTDRPTNVATLPIGYADGVQRMRWNRGGSVLIGGRRRPIVGVVTMDQMVVDCGDDAVAPGDEAVLLGRQGGETIDAWEWAGQADTIGYEVVCGIGARVERRYHDGR